MNPIAILSVQLAQAGSSVSTPINATVTTHTQWMAVNDGLIWFWAFLACVVAFATFILMAHAMLPSLVSSRQLPQRTLAVRPVVYLLAFVFLAAAMFCFANIVTHLQVLYDLYGKLWI